MRAPTGEEWVVQRIMSFNQGALGVVPWTDPTPADIKSSSSAFALSLSKITPYLFNPASVRVVGGTSVAAWSANTRARAFDEHQLCKPDCQLGALGLERASATTAVVSGVAETVYGGFTLGLVGSVAFVVAA